MVVGGSEAGTLRTHGALVAGAAPAETYPITDFVVTESVLPSMIGSLAEGTIVISQPMEGFHWNGSTDTQWWRASGQYTNGAWFSDDESSYAYLFLPGSYQLRHTSNPSDILAGSSQLNLTPVEPVTVTGWASVRDHGGTEPAIALDGAAVVTEPRVGGLQKVLVDFDADVTSQYALGRVVVDVGLTVTGESLIDNGTTLVIELSGSTDATCCTIDVSACVASLVGDSDFMVRILAGDVNSDGVVSNSDMIAVRVRRGQSVTEDTCRYDVTCDGVIGNSDMIQIRGRRGHQVSCP